MGVFYASFAAANNHIYVTVQEGASWVFELGREGILVQENNLRQSMWSSPFFHEDRIYFRGFETLFCIEAGR